MEGVDCFALLGMARGPVVDASDLEENFRRRSARVHPDRIEADGGGEFVQLNTARQCLADPAECLRHFLALEGFGRGREDKPQPTCRVLDTGFGIGKSLQHADRFLEKRSDDSALTRALRMDEAMEIQELLEKSLETVDAGMESLRKEAVQISHSCDGTLDASQAACLHALADAMVYHRRWKEQIRDRLSNLAIWILG